MTLRSGLWLCLLSLSALAQTRLAGGRCRESCERWQKPTNGASVCTRCVTQVSGDRGSWVLDFKAPADALNAVLADDDWQVRWGAVRALAAAQKKSEVAGLTGWISSEKDPTRACVTALHLAGSRRQTLSTLLNAGSRPLARCAEKDASVLEALRLELYSPDALVRDEALQHLALARGVAEGRVVLDAMASRPPASDRIVAGLLLDRAKDLGPPAGLAVLQPSTPADALLINRLLTVYGAMIELERPRLASPDIAQRREAVISLAHLGPLGARELEGVLTDADFPLRVRAARAIARGEGKTLEQLVSEKLSPQNAVADAARITWAGFLGARGETGCDAPLRAAWTEPKLSDPVRAAALAALGACAGARALPDINAALDGVNPVLQAGAIDAVANVPRLPQAPALIELALAHRQLPVLSAAARAIAAHRLTTKVPAVLELFGHTSPELRREAATALGSLGDRRALAPLLRGLTDDSDAAVRVACAQALGALGDRSAVSALALATDKEASVLVREAAKESLRKLGFERASPAGSTRPQDPP